MEKRFIEPPILTVNQDSRSDCGLCIRICPTQNFRSSKVTLRTATRVHHPEECVLYGQCLCVCPTSSIIHSGFDPGSPHNRVGWVRNTAIVYGEENMKIVLDLTADYIQRLLKLLKSNFLKIMAKFTITWAGRI